LKSNMIKHDRELSILTVGALTLSLLLGASMASAATVVLDGDNVTAILDLGIADRDDVVTFYDVGFEFGSANDVYDGPGSSPMLPFLSEEDAFLARAQVMGFLNTEVNPVPTGAGPTGADQFFIGAEYDDSSTLPIVISFGSEYFSGGGNLMQWQVCTTDCILSGLELGIKIAPASDSLTYVTFTPTSTVPVPAAAWLFGSALLGLGVIKRKKA
jgi:hypothetical protein